MTVRLVLAAALAAAVLPGAALAGPPVPPDPNDLPIPEVHTFCTVRFREVPIFSDDVPVQPVVPYFAC